MAFYGLDVSQYQGEINWNQVKSAGKVFAMVGAVTTALW